MKYNKGWENLRPIKKGEVRNPTGKGGGPNPELTELRRMSAHQVAEIGTLIVSKNLTKLQDIINDAIGTKTKPPNPNSKHSALKVWMARVALKGIGKGDPHALDVLLNRIVGKVKDRIEVGGLDGGPVRALVGAMSAEERETELKRLRKMRDDAGED